MKYSRRVSAFYRQAALRSPSRARAGRIQALPWSGRFVLNPGVYVVAKSGYRVQQFSSSNCSLMQLPRLTLVATAFTAVALTGCQTNSVLPGETSTGLPYRPPGVATYVETPEGFVAPVPGEPLSERRYLPPTPEIENPPLSSNPRNSGAPPYLRTKEQTAIELAIPQNEWVQAASSWRGAPYRVGGTTRDGVDCSGLVQQLFKEVRNKDVPRTTSEQWEKSVAVAQLQPGDLVFFNTRRVFGDETTHVGLIVGNRVFVHASTSMGVCYGSLDDAYWSKRFTGSRRLEL